MKIVGSEFKSLEGRLELSLLTGNAISSLAIATTSERLLLITDEMRRPVSERDAIRSQVMDTLEAQREIRRPA
jgi:hypothetical protein